jgi:hypothetical protein
MSEQARQLLRTADAQIAELIELFSGRDDGVLARPCPERAKLADGTVGAVAWHTAENYRRIAGFLNDQPDGGHPLARSAQDVTIPALLRLLIGGRDSLGILGELSDERLNAVPTARAIRFCDGRRTLQQVVSGLLNHQAHNVETLKAAAS